MSEDKLVNKLKILKNPSKKSAKELLSDLAGKKGYNVSIDQVGDVVVRIDKSQVPMSLNDRKVYK